MEPFYLIPSFNDGPRSSDCTFRCEFLTLKIARNMKTKKGEISQLSSVLLGFTHPLRILQVHRATKHVCWVDWADNRPQTCGDERLLHPFVLKCGCGGSYFRKFCGGCKRILEADGRCCQRNGGDSNGMPALPGFAPGAPHRCGFRFMHQRIISR